jgi:hypothetical protein
LVVEDDKCDLSGEFTQLVVESYVMYGNWLKLFCCSSDWYVVKLHVVFFGTPCSEKAMCSLILYIWFIFICSKKIYLIWKN